jgi:hypothetical protein
MESDAKTNLLGAALHFNPELKQEVEEWVRRLVEAQVRSILSDSFFVENMLRNSMPAFRRVLLDAQFETMQKINSNKYAVGL